MDPRLVRLYGEGSYPTYINFVCLDSDARRAGASPSARIRIKISDSKVLHIKTRGAYGGIVYQPTSDLTPPSRPTERLRGDVE